MITVKFFAATKEQLATSQLTLDISKTSVADLKATLEARGMPWQKALQHTLVAVNQSMATPETMIHAGDEVAFFPPVTGG
ncbi:molybdopterin converting factor subunit 1 [Thaumasiovibrio sp. DFM-14]|uniref:molybdopterin converting factor subunit 1 n=1 Tax=Thaumasiovibrio sp. DFM-14 TaxID=3384792 RepID=UPI0039A14BDE